jgi:hypothetical protein
MPQGPSKVIPRLTDRFCSPLAGFPNWNWIVCGGPVPSSSSGWRQNVSLLARLKAMSDASRKKKKEHAKKQARRERKTHDSFSRTVAEWLDFDHGFLLRCFANLHKRSRRSGSPSGEPLTGIGGARTSTELPSSELDQGLAAVALQRTFQLREHPRVFLTELPVPRRALIASVRRGYRFGIERAIDPCGVSSGRIE